jgi:integrase
MSVETRSAGRRSYGDGGIDPRGENRWRLRYRVNGQRYTKAFVGPLTDAKRELRRLLKSADDGAHVAPNKMTLADWIAEWVKGRPVNERTRERYKGLLQNQVAPTLGNRRLQALTPSDLDALYLKLGESGLAPRTVHHVHVVLSCCLRSAVRKGLI